MDLKPFSKFEAQSMYEKDVKEYLIFIGLVILITPIIQIFDLVLISEFFITRVVPNESFVKSYRVGATILTATRSGRYLVLTLCLSGDDRYLNSVISITKPRTLGRTDGFV